MLWARLGTRVLAVALAAVMLAAGFLAVTLAVGGQVVEGSHGDCEVTDLGTFGAEGDSELQG